ncbi:MAG: sulfurtransferase TusA family protein [Desulfobacula sp.]|uniref:sulfurtransferase TusA family protein n=1 Tax=Desulfobacula sp. TaxID=2593537 RepID=UPI001D7A4410|nr:sulfurtransferase TusA family protein [Desulfobacula sp.]MBT4508715.1 sulfurtransferase TusA family protein [Desulfobacula sp.]MBT4878076.1 sulfurtransferase TusA family protein [Desulfobacula sp.]MBT5546732.1 sulfurtransferase TusA family protein [Desulfobacula sp.]MBT6751702.1 sulfurtransferase TusA family protein [Desulfobacula sp.]
MPINRNIDIRDIDWPLCILNCKKEVNQMKKGEQMQVIVKDIDVVSNLIALVEQTFGCSIVKHREDNHYRLVIRKRQ